MKNQNKKIIKERELDKLFRKIFDNKIMKNIKDDITFILLSLGVGSISYFYLINYLQKNIVNKVKDFMDNIDTVSAVSYNNTGYLIAGFMIIILSILFLNKSRRTRYLILFFIASIFFGGISIFAILILGEKLFFSILCLLSISLLIYVLINALENIYGWLKIDKSKDNQIDVAKLTFIWGVIIFLYNLLK